MAKLNWKESRDGWRVYEAFASRAVGGKYQILNQGNKLGFLIRYRPPPNEKGIRWWWRDIGTAATASEAIALAQADNDKKLVAAIAAQHA